MKNYYKVKENKVLSALLISIIFCVGISSCTTQDFEYAGKNKDVYRVKLENVGDKTVTYTSEVSFFYIDKKDSIEEPDEKTISPGDEIRLVTESKEGVYGVSANIFIEHPTAKIRLTLEKGTGTGDNFVLDKVIAEKTGKYTQGIRDGQIF